MKTLVDEQRTECTHTPESEYATEHVSTLETLTSYQGDIRETGTRRS